MTDPGFRFEHRPEGTFAYRRDRREVCDFCLDPEPRWHFPTTEMPVVGHPAIQAGADDGFLACEQCHRLVVQSSIGALVERACERQRINQPPGIHRDLEVRYPPLPIQRRLMRENVLRFLDARTGPPRRYEP